MSRPPPSPTLGGVVATHYGTPGPAVSTAGYEFERLALNGSPRRESIALMLPHNPITPPSEKSKARLVTGLCPTRKT
jgi:hypothetical protein